MSRRKNKHHNDDLQEYYSEKLNNLNHILHVNFSKKAN